MTRPIRYAMLMHMGLQGGSWSRQVPLRPTRRLPAQLLIAILLASPAVVLAPVPPAVAVAWGPWQTSGTFPVLPGFQSVACPTAQSCVAVGYGIAHTTDGGTQWVPTALPDSLIRLWGVSCPSPTVCLAAGEGDGGGPSIIRSDDGGMTWMTQSLPAITNAESLRSVVCGSTSFCLASTFGQESLPQAMITHNGGATWSVVPWPSSFGVQYLAGLACSNSHHCLVTAEVTNGRTEFLAALVTTDAGSSWALHHIAEESLAPPTTGFGLSCFDATSCFAAGPGQQIFATADGGKVWARQSTPSDIEAITSIACGSTDTCIAVGESSNWGAGAVGTTDGGSQWSDLTLPSTLPQDAPLYGVSCATAMDCTAVGGSDAEGDASGIAVATLDAGADWEAQQVPPSVDQLSSIGCTSAKACVAVGYGGSSSPNIGILATTTDAGVDWSVTSPAATAGLSGVACPSPSECIAVGVSSNLYVPAILRSTDGGSTWQQMPVPQGLQSTLTAVACPSPTECFATGTYPDGGILETTDGGETWTVTSAAASEANLKGIACLSVSDCVAVGDNPGLAGTVFSTEDGGVTWTQETVSTASQLWGVACASTAVCLVSGDDRNQQGAVFRTLDGGSTWSAESLPTPTPNPPEQWFMDGITCPTASNCYSGASFGAIYASTDEGSTWTMQSVPTGEGGGDGIACPVTTSCFAVGVYAWGGSVLQQQNDAVGIITPSLPPGAVDEPYSAALSATSGTPPYQWSVPAGELPAGLSIGTTTGSITGTPEAGGSFSPTFTVTDSTGQSASVTIPLSIAKLSSTVTISENPTIASYRDPVTYHVDVTGSGATPSGTATISIGSITQCVATAPTGHCTSKTAPVGTDVVTVTYGGDAEHVAATASTVLDVVPAQTTTAITVSPTVATQGSEVTFSATTSSRWIRPHGSVTFTFAGTSLTTFCSATVRKGLGTCRAPVVLVGSLEVTGTFSGAPNFASSTGTANLTITLPTLPREQSTAPLFRRIQRGLVPVTRSQSGGGSIPSSARHKALASDRARQRA